MAERDNAQSEIAFRIGINVGDIIVDDGDIFGDGVNVAARVESEREPGGVCLSGSAYEQVGASRLIRSMTMASDPSRTSTRGEALCGVVSRINASYKPTVSRASSAA